MKHGLVEVRRRTRRTHGSLGQSHPSHSSEPGGTPAFRTIPSANCPSSASRPSGALRAWARMKDTAASASARGRASLHPHATSDSGCEIGMFIRSYWVVIRRFDQSLTNTDFDENRRSCSKFDLKKFFLISYRPPDICIFLRSNFGSLRPYLMDS